MDGHFRAFTFVSRITSVEPGVRIRGTYAIPPDLGSFAHSLVAEAVGQLAAWSAMAAVDFKFRPVAGLAGKIELLSPVRPGQTLELAAELETVDTEAVAYGGTASVEGVPVIKLENCVGPMLPMEDFDDPSAMREQFGRFCRETAAPGGFRGTPPVRIEPSASETGKSKRATLHVPDSAPFFADHFPRRPVFPGTLLMNFNLQLAAQLAAELPVPAPGDTWKLRAISDVKLRAFTPPGEILECEAKVAECSDHSALLLMQTRKSTRTVGGAKVRFALEEHS
jgi:3-hydroxymyristoyl/3-hydroxydecanoyl-(acyl carrier protein) dehydratase